MKEALAFPALFKNNQKLNEKYKFFHLKVRSYIKFKTNINYYKYEGLKVHSFIHFSHLRIAQPMTFTFIKKKLATSLGHSATMPYKISSTNFGNFSYVIEPFRGEISRGGREFSIEWDLDFSTLFKKR